MTCRVYLRCRTEYPEDCPLVCSPFYHLCKAIRFPTLAFSTKEGTMVRITPNDRRALHLSFLQLEIIRNGFDTNIIDGLLCNFHCLFRTIKIILMWEMRLTSWRSLRFSSFNLSTSLWWMFPGWRWRVPSPFHADSIWVLLWGWLLSHRLRILPCKLGLGLWLHRFDFNRLISSDLHWWLWLDCTTTFLLLLFLTSSNCPYFPRQPQTS